MVGNPKIGQDARRDSRCSRCRTPIMSWWLAAITKSAVSFGVHADLMIGGRPEARHGCAPILGLLVRIGQFCTGRAPRQPTVGLCVQRVATYVGSYIWASAW